MKAVRCLQGMLGLGVTATLLLLWMLASGHGQAGTPDSRIGTVAPEWEVEDWWQGEARQLRELKGKVVLVRWWTAPGCPYCSASAPALNEFHQRYRREGLEVVGFYHHKSTSTLRRDKVKAHAKKLGFQFPLAIDPEWRTLRNWWLDHGERRWTSVSFLLDRKGVIRHIHPGGQYVRGDDAYRELKAKIEELLAEDKGVSPKH
ncbi:MAG TPA: TlpA disulfide reductase family protein [Methylomirabilota bacterium]|nr:TlpA disulfide reductase family protein [Methylomirabilota bacterium]